MIFLRMLFQVFEKKKVAGDPFFIKVCEGAPEVDKCIIIFD